MKKDKAAGNSGVVTEIFTAAVDAAQYAHDVVLTL